jgi:hypothetical protein
MVLVLQALRAALGFLSLREIPRRLARFLDHLARPKTRVRPKQIARFLAGLQPVPG